MTARCAVPGKRHRWFGLAVLGLVAGSVCAGSVDSPGNDALARQLAQGKRIYEQGILINGDTIHGTVQGDVPLSGRQVVCANCHRNSGMGSSEGRKVAAPVTGPALFEDHEIRPGSNLVDSPYRRLRMGDITPGHPRVLRPAYTVKSLKLAIRAGLDSAGRPMDPLMPRYGMGDADLEALIAYMKTLSAEPAPGVTDTTIRMATIVSDGVDPERRRLMLEVLNTFVADKNQETRQESERAEHGPWHKDWHYKTYRKWILDVWELHGDPAGWPAQLQAQYDAAPVFAVVSGLVDGSWAPIHGFCEAVRLPCVFPNTELPVVAEQDFYPVYFSKGMILEAQLLAAHLARNDGPPTGLVQVYRDDDESRTAAEQFRRLVPGEIRLSSIRLETGQAADAAFWRELLTAHTGEQLVAWLPEADLQGLASVLAASPSGTAPDPIYLSSTLLNLRADGLPDELLAHVLLLHPFNLPDAIPMQLRRSRVWLIHKGIDPLGPNERLQTNTYFAAITAAAAVKHIGGNFSREYFIERLEHMVDNSMLISFYPRFSMAPYQRFISKGGYVLKPRRDPQGVHYAAVGDLIIP